MKVYSILVFVAVLLCCRHASAQLVQNDIGTHSMILNSSTKSVKVDKQYMNVQGKYLWDKDWHRAAVQMKPGNIFRLKAIKVNFLTNELHYPEGADEMAVPVDNMKRIVMFSNDTGGDTTKIDATFLVLVDPADKNKKQVLFELLTNGNIQLLKQTKVGTNKMRVDPIVGQSETILFYQSLTYYIKRGDTMTPLKGLNKSTVMGAVPEAEANNDWLSANKNKLKKEEDVVAFLTYLNSKSGS
jgi:hypothetical protein